MNSLIANCVANSDQSSHAANKLEKLSSGTVYVPEMLGCTCALEMQNRLWSKKSKQWLVWAYLRCILPP